ncbi:hypothetical protein [Gaetbulibacter sp. PBL-D1]|uniref:hypothetical protein n=1 Tax=Gaetbulibacter sp. PBL-D1 TaxID=3422594 RepID=UPI003D2F3A9E
MGNIEKIQNLYDQVIDKKELIDKVAEEFNLRKVSVRTNWFTRFDIPERYNVQEKLIELLEKIIDEQEEIIEEPKQAV